MEYLSDVDLLAGGAMNGDLSDIFIADLDKLIDQADQQLYSNPTSDWMPHGVLILMKIEKERLESMKNGNAFKGIVKLFKMLG